MGFAECAPTQTSCSCWRLRRSVWAKRVSLSGGVPDMPAAAVDHEPRRLVGLQCDERRVDLDNITRLHKNIDDVDVVRVTDVRNNQI